MDETLYLLTFVVQDVLQLKAHTEANIQVCTRRPLSKHKQTANCDGYIA